MLLIGQNKLRETKRGQRTNANRYGNTVGQFCTLDARHFCINYG